MIPAILRRFYIWTKCRTIKRLSISVSWWVSGQNLAYCYIKHMQAHTNALGNSKLINEYVRISYLSKYSKICRRIANKYIWFKYTDLNGKGLVSAVRSIGSLQESMWYRIVRIWDQTKVEPTEDETIGEIHPHTICEYHLGSEVSPFLSFFLLLMSRFVLIRVHSHSCG